jgi:glycosyltransferase involved in cell wall biosynthesis
MISEQELGFVRELFPSAHSRYIPCSVDPLTYKPSTIERDVNLVFIVAWLGEHNAYRKSIPEIVEAIPLVLAERPGTRFVFAGKQGAAYPDLRNRAVALGIDDAIEWLGTIPEDAKIALLQQCGVYLQPSRYEGFGLAILEAMSCGAPIVTSPVGAVPEVVGDTTFFCDGESSRSIADAVLSVQADPERGKQMGSRARVRATRLFSNERRTIELSHAINELIGHN